MEELCNSSKSSIPVFKLVNINLLSRFDILNNHAGVNCTLRRNCSAKMVKHTLFREIKLIDWSSFKH